MRATAVKAKGTWAGEPADVVVLEFDDRHRRRVSMEGVNGLHFVLDLAEALMLRGGDALVLDDGRLVEVVAAPEALLEVRGREPSDLVRIAWHLGNRHLPTQLLQKSLRIRRDHVVEEMVKGLGARIVEIEAPFDPEGGAYAKGAEAAPHGRDDHASHDHHGHDHHHDHDHHHHHEDHQGHAHAHGHTHS